MAEATEAQELLKAGKLPEALKALEGAVRKNPADAGLRVFLFQTLIVMGQWERAVTQVKLAAEMDGKNALLPLMYLDAIQCEALRTEVFAGKRQPLIFGKPAEWVGWLVQAVALIGQGKLAEGRALRDKAFEAAPAVSGKITTTAPGETPFEWIADGDGRLGPVLEVIFEGKYLWVPLNCIKAITLEGPGDLRDVVWLPAQFTWSNGGTGVGLIPGRYPGSEKAADPLLALSRSTAWEDLGDEFFVGLGQRVLTTDAGEYSLLEIRELKLDVAEDASMSAPAPVDAVAAEPDA